MSDDKPIGDGTIITAPTPVRTWEIVQYVTGPLEGELQDWPANIQDQVFEAFERLVDKVELPLAIVGSVCDVDYGEAVDRTQDKYFVRIIASEIVAAYEPSTAKNEAQRLYEQFRKGRVH